LIWISNNEVTPGFEDAIDDEIERPHKEVVALKIRCSQLEGKVIGYRLTAEQYERLWTIGQNPQMDQMPRLDAREIPF
jgi:hypothetical protein